MLPLIYLLGLLLLAVLALRSVRRVQALSSPKSVSGSETGNFEAYLARIETLAGGEYDEFFVTATEAGGPRFLQVSASRDGSGVLRYLFDMPVTEWSRGYAVRIEAEARHRGLDVVRQTNGQMTFLDVEFQTSGDHAIFARWVVGEVFGLSPDVTYTIRWG